MARIFLGPRILSDPKNLAFVALPVALNEQSSSAIETTCWVSHGGDVQKVPRDDNAHSPGLVVPQAGDIRCDCGNDAIVSLSFHRPKRWNMRVLRKLSEFPKGIQGVNQTPI
jgi:hypothetical protein